MPPPAVHRMVPDNAMPFYCVSMFAKFNNHDLTKKLQMAWKLFDLLSVWLAFYARKVAGWKKNGRLNDASLAIFSQRMILMAQSWQFLEISQMVLSQMVSWSWCSLGFERTLSKSIYFDDISNPYPNHTHSATCKLDNDIQSSHQTFFFCCSNRITKVFV